MSAQIIPISDRAIESWLKNYPAKFLACRMGHDFPKLVPGTRKFVRTWFEWDEQTKQRHVCQRCKSCGRVRLRPLVKRGRGWILGGKSWKYKDPEGYAQPPGYGLNRGDFSEVYWNAIIEDFDASEERVQEYLGNGHGRT